MSTVATIHRRGEGTRFVLNPGIVQASGKHILDRYVGRVQGSDVLNDEVKDNAATGNDVGICRVERLGQGDVDLRKESEIDCRIGVAVGVVIIGRFGIGFQRDGSTDHVATGKGRAVVVVVDVVIWIAGRIVSGAVGKTKQAGTRLELTGRDDHGVVARIKPREVVGPVCPGGGRCNRRIGVGVDHIIGTGKLIQIDGDPEDPRFATLTDAVVLPATGIILEQLAAK